MTSRNDGTRRDLGEGIAAILRIGTVLTVLIIGVAFIVASMTGLPSRGERPLTDYLTRSGPDAPIAVGLLGLTLLPLIVVGYAARSFARTGERDRLITTIVVLVLLVGSLVLAVVIGSAS